jgi:hypothetical protein
MTITVKDIQLGGDLSDFLSVVDEVYAGDPHYVRPLDLEVSGRLSRKNPFFEHAEGMAFVAYENGLPVGRCTAQVDAAYSERHGEAAGFFGFLDTVDKQEVTTALLERAAAYLRERGMKKMLGPFSISSNDEIGCLVDGFDTPPMIMMPHHRPYQGKLIEGAGLQKAKDLYAWRYVVGPLPRRAQKGYDQIAALPEVSVRNVDKSNLTREIEEVMSIFNDAWSDNWGYVPLSRAELTKLADDLKLILEPRLTLVLSIDGEPAAFAIALPNLNEHLKPLAGQLFPTGALSLLYGMKVKGTRTARLALLGVRKKYRTMKRYGGLSTYMYAELAKSGQRLGIDWGELSWTLEDNTPVNLGIKLMGGKIYKTYRIFDKNL